MVKTLSTKFADQIHPFGAVIDKTSIVFVDRCELRARAHPQKPSRAAHPGPRSVYEPPSSTDAPRATSHQSRTDSHLPDPSLLSSAPWRTGAAQPPPRAPGGPPKKVTPTSTTRAPTSSASASSAPHVAGPRSRTPPRAAPQPIRLTELVPIPMPTSEQIDNQGKLVLHFYVR